MALGGITPKQKLTLVVDLYFWRVLKMGGLPLLGISRSGFYGANKRVEAPASVCPVTV